jgi:Flp pilus assembly protein TadG
MAAMNTPNRASRQEGAELIEFALVLPLLLLVVMGIFDFSFAFQRYQVLTNAAREGARIGVLPGYGDADITTRVQEYATASGLPDAGTLLSTTIDRGSAGPVGNTFGVVTVNASYPHPFTFLAPIAALFGGGFGAVNLTGSATMRVESP